MLIIFLKPAVEEVGENTSAAICQQEGEPIFKGNELANLARHFVKPKKLF
jgi:hypothetical protein